ncbi:MAG: reverse gyrase [Thermofilaceae archaeon]|nr:reverse gyrase [Thermofilaceae archaeon]
MKHMIIRAQCPNCGGEISDERLSLSLPCETCLPEPLVRVLDTRSSISRLEFLSEVYSLLVKNEKNRGYEKLLRDEEELHSFETFFERALGNSPWSAQRTWARRVLKGMSFTILAPTGVGKSVFGMLMALFLSSKGKKCYLILPTSLLVKQTNDKISKYMEKLGLNIKVVSFMTGSSRAKNEILERIKQNDFDILITTSQFISRNFEFLKNIKFDFIFIDDVDAVIKSSKNIDKILILLGFNSDIINEALKIVKMLLYKKYGEQKYSEPSKELEDLRRSLRETVDKMQVGVLVVSTATGKPRGLRVRLFRELLNFEIGSRAEYLRNILDSYLIVEKDELEKKAVEMIAKLGKGGLIFVQPGVSEEYLNRLQVLLEKNGVKARMITSRKREELEAFERGDVDVLIGYATYYGLLVRGIDLPHVIRYAVFIEVPHFRFAVDVDEASPIRLLLLAQTLRSVVKGDDATLLDRLVVNVRRYVMGLEPSMYRMLTDSLINNIRPEGFPGYLYDRLEELRKLLKDILSRKDLLGELEAKNLVSFKFFNGKSYVVFPDVLTYLQASGRTSRMYAGGISRGLSIVVTSDEKLLKALIKQVEWYSDDIKWISFDNLDLKKILEEIDNDRELIKSLMKGRVKGEASDRVKTVLVIVESPTKARTIASFFGRPSQRRVHGLHVYEISTGNLQLLVAASKGHVLDLITSGGFHGVRTENGAFLPVYAPINRCLRCGNQFTESRDDNCPRCGSKDVVSQSEVIEALKEVAAEVDLVLIATDPDTEGEKIAWDLNVLLRPYTREIKRMEFHEITKRAFENALQNLRQIDLRRVEAQLVRRIEDRWIGFSLSKNLWGEFGSQWLSAGRVQTPVLGWIIERYREAKASLKTLYYVKLENGLVLTFETDLTGKDSRRFVKKLRETEVIVENLGTETVHVSPPPPFSTDTLLKEASLSLKLGVNEIMKLAQDLFEMGLITYHRTDSISVSSTGISIARTYITENYGENMFVGRAWSQPGAHECIRPTRPHDSETLKALVNQGVLQLAIPLTYYHYRLYDLIFRRFIASQMREAILNVSRFRISANVLNKELSVYTEVVQLGFSIIYNTFRLSRLSPGVYRVADVRHRRMPTTRLYSQADVVAKMKEEKIGRPSTYARIISTLLERKYVIETKNHKLLPTKLGIKVYEYLSEKYRNLISTERTRIVEETMDKIERGEINYLDALREFYQEVVQIG